MLGYKGLARSQTKFLNNLFQSNGVSGDVESVSHERELVLKKRVTAGDRDDSRGDSDRPAAGLNRKVVSDFGVDVRKFSSVSGAVLMVEPAVGGNRSYDQSDCPDGQLRPGDVLVAVNGVDVTDMDRESVMKAIAAAAQDSGQCKIKVSHKTMQPITRIMVSKSKYWISEKIRVCQYPFAHIFKGIFQSQYSHF